MEIYYLGKNNKFKLIEDHSEECLDLDKKIKYNDNLILASWEEFKSEIYEFLNNTEEDNRKILHKKFLDIYNNKAYSFKYDKLKVNNLYN